MPGPPVPGQFGTPATPGPKRGVGGKIKLVAAAVALSLGSGGVGAAAALALADSGVVEVTKTYQAAPVVDRSSLSDIAARVQPSVVSIQAGTAGGSGVVLSEDGYILTNNHVVAGADRLVVTFSDGKRARASIVGTDARTDLAVIKAQNVSGLQPAKFGDSDAMRVGDTVLALGSPLGLDGSVTAGIVSALGRTIRASDSRSPVRGATISGVIQTDAAINPGNSGGALVNLNGEVIGINTAIATAGGSGNIGVGFAIPGNKAKQVAEQLRKGERVKHAYLGVSVTPAEGGGAEVAAVAEGSPAAEAGLRPGDVIIKMGQNVITDSDDLVAAVQSHNVGDRVEITYQRDGSEHTTTVTLAEAS
ncbi:MAG: trypsin-like peptidase domain-containing protein [Dactylosporangium sp.]|nr:trypsin-like peptidase domain-containing protein [Dactylosporangium sp.]